MKRNHHSPLRLGARMVLAAALTVSSAAVAAAQVPSGKLDPVLRQRSMQLTGRSRVIVEFRSAPDVRVFPRGTVGGHGGERALVGEVDNRLLVSLAADARVARVMIDRPAFATLDRTARAVGAIAAREEFGVDGRGVGIAIVDSGITSFHDDLYQSRSRSVTDRVVHFKDFTRPASKTLWATPTPVDEYGHGTHVAGIIAGSGADSRGSRRGIAPGAHLIGLKVLDAQGHGYISDVIAAIDYAISVKVAFNIRIINLSVASAVLESYATDPLTLAARRATDAGIVVIAAAGNIGQNANDQTQFGGITSPGNAPWVLTIGASSHEGTARRSDDALAAFSSRGPTWVDFAAKPDLIAPGVGIESLSDPHSTLYEAMSEYLLSGAVDTWYKPYLSLTGTSMAAPVVTGTVALMLQANPALTPNAVKAILQYTAQTRDGEDFLAQGAGLLNTRGAVRLASFFAAPRSGVGETADVIEGELIPWARHIIWGNYRVTGGVPLPGGNSNAWALDVAWGALTTPQGAPVVWGATSDQNIVWSTTAGNDNNIVWSTAADNNIVWSTAGAVGSDNNIVWSTTSNDQNIVWSTTRSDENIVWSTAGAATDQNIVWSTAFVQNVVWGTACGGRNCRGVIWGSRSGGKVWGTTAVDQNIVWSTVAGTRDENIVWSTVTGTRDENIVWSTVSGNDQNIVWSTATTGQVVWPASIR